MSGVAHARNLIGPVLSRAYRIRMTGAHHLPTRGPVIVISDQQGLLDPTILATALPRPVRVMSQGTGVAPRWTGLAMSLGRIEVDADSSAWCALQQGVVALDRGDALGVFMSTPFGSPVLTPPAAMGAYLHAGTGAPLVAVTLFDTSGRRPTDLPRPRSVIECHVAPAVDLPVPEDSVSLASLRQHAERIRQICVDARSVAAARSGRDAQGAEPDRGPRGVEAHNGRRD